MVFVRICAVNLNKRKKKTTTTTTTTVSMSVVEGNASIVPAVLRVRFALVGRELEQQLNGS